MSEWIEKSLGEVTSYIAKGIPPKYIEKLTENAIYVLNQKCNRDFAISYESARIHDLTKKRVADEKMLNVGDVLVNSTGEGTAGRIAQLWDIPYPTTTDGHMITLRPTEEVDPLYCGYAIKAQQALIESLAEGSTGQTEINRKRLQEEVIIAFPKDKDKQNCTAKILENIDKKITINNEINRNLSEQMQALFASVFYPEIEAGNKVSLGDYLYIKGRIGWKGLKKDEYLDESEYRIINGESLTATGIDWAKAGYISEERYIESPEIMLQEGDILISKDGTIGKIGYVNKLEKPTSVASGIFVVRNLKPEEVSTVFIYCLLNSDYFKSFIASRTEGSVIPHLYQKDFVTLEIPLLTQEQLNIFNGSVNPLFELYFTNQTENIRLTALRDTLLPRLMCGELDVSDINI